jgi:hypothetical protein
MNVKGEQSETGSMGGEWRKRKKTKGGQKIEIHYMYMFSKIA